MKIIDIFILSYLILAIMVCTGKVEVNFLENFISQYSKQLLNYVLHIQGVRQPNQLPQWHILLDMLHQCMRNCVSFSQRRLRYSILKRVFNNFLEKNLLTDFY